MPQNQPDHATAHLRQRLREPSVTAFRAIEPPLGKMTEMAAARPGTGQEVAVNRRILLTCSSGKGLLPAWLAVQLSEK